MKGLLQSTPLFTDEYKANMLEAAHSRAKFDQWHVAMHRDVRDTLDADARHALDQEAEHHLFAAFPDALSTPQKKAEELRGLLPQIPASLNGDHLFLGMFIKDAGVRQRVAADPKRFPSISFLAPALNLNGFGAGMNLKGHHEFGYLATSQ